MSAKHDKDSYVEYVMQPQDPNNPKPHSEESAKMVDDAIKIVSEKMTKEAMTETKVVLQHAEEVLDAVRLGLRPLLKVIRDSGRYDSDATLEIVRKAFQDHYCKWSKDDMVVVVSALMAGSCREGIDEYMAGYQTGQ